MARLFGFIGNRADLGPQVLERESKALAVRSKGVTLGWGLGFYQAGEVLLRRRPIDDKAEIDVARVAKDVRADVLLGHVRTATVGNLRTENTHPFRYRQWLFAHTGTIEKFSEIRERVVESIPEFLRRNVRGDTDSELLFHMFLSFLHDAGRLGDSSVDPGVTRAALRSTLSLLARIREQQGDAAGAMNVLATDGEHMVGVHKSDKMAFCLIRGRADLERLLGGDALQRLRIPDMASCRFCLLASDFDEDPTGWTTVPMDAMVTVTRSDGPTIESL
jgi:predicted glutamine amidotransferase